MDGLFDLTDQGCARDGASRGIGRGAARALASVGATVIAGVRDEDRGRPLGPAPGSRFGRARGHGRPARGRRRAGPSMHW